MTDHQRGALDAAEKPVSPKLYLILGFLTLLNVLNFVDRSLLQFFAVDVMRDLSLSNFQFALLTGIVFSLFYTVVGLLMGTVADAYNRPRLIAAGLFVWSLLTALTGLVRNFFQITMARAFVGVGEASLSPSALSMLSDLFPLKKRGFAGSFYYLGIPIGAGLSGIIAGTLGARIGWRNCFILLGVIGVVLTGLVLLIKDPPRGQSDHTESVAEGTVPPRSLRDILKALRLSFGHSSSLWMLLLASTLIVFSHGATILDQPWLVNEKGFEVAAGQRIFGFIFLVGGVAGSLFGGWGSDWFYKRYAGGRIKFVLLVYLVSAPLTLGYRFLSPDLPFHLFYVMAFIGSVSFMVPYGTLMVSIQELTAVRSRATIVALTILCWALLGTAFGVGVSGWLVDHFKSLGWAQPYSWGLALVLIPTLFALPLLYFSSLRYDREVAWIRSQN